MAKKRKVNTTPPKTVQNIAKKALETRKKAKKSDKGGLTPKEASKEGIKSGVSSARKIASGKPLSREQISAMARFGRFLGNVKTKKGRNAVNLWGGASGINWAKRKLKEIDKNK